MSRRIYDVDLMVTRAIQNGPKTLAELVPYTGMSRETIRLALVRLRGHGSIVADGGKYRTAQQEAA